MTKVMFFEQNKCSCGMGFSLLCIIFACLQITLCKLCGDVQLYGPTDTIQSPQYPDAYPNNMNCMWFIHSSPKSILTISVEDLDIEPDEPKTCGFNTEPCCRHNWLTLPSTGSAKMHKYCGHNPVIKNITINNKAVVIIKFHSSKVVAGGRGFRLRYNIVSKEYEPCKETEFQCADGQCVHAQMRCDGYSQCKDHSDEHDCEDPCLSNGKVSCFDGGCFDNATQLCDGKRDCLNGRDELYCSLPDITQECEIKCDTGEGCYKLHEVCDGKPDCLDYSDEIDCGYCAKGHALCNFQTRYCFEPSTEMCNGKFNCPLGEDEVGCVPGCEKSIACSSGEGCYLPSQRCNSQSDCTDESDEARCPPELCATLHDKRQCHNGRCLPARLWCDGVDDCSDGSDEDGCLKMSVVTAVIMGSLLCGLLLVITVSCTFRIYIQRLTATPSNYHLHLSQHLASRLRMSHSVSLPALIDDDYFRREPPPAYSVAVGECSTTDTSDILLNAQTPPQLFSAQSSSVNMLDYCAQIQHARRHRRYLTSSRRQRGRNRPQLEVFSNQDSSVKAQNVETSDSQCEASSSQSSPSRESVTSSSYLSGSDDNTLLLHS